jgi:hypothetical protein
MTLGQHPVTRFSYKSNHLYFSDDMRPNVAAQWLSHLLRFRRDPGSNLEPYISYSEHVFVVFCNKNVCLF